MKSPTRDLAMGFIQATIHKLWDGFLQNMSVMLSAFIFSGSYLIAINKAVEFQTMIRRVPSDYFLTPLILLTVILLAVIKVNMRHRAELKKLFQEPNIDEDKNRFVTHFGLWWKMYPGSEYIEDFPYCSCCNPLVKLVQTEWYPDEVYKCSKTNTEYKLYDEVPRKREQVLSSLRNAYFHSIPDQIRNNFIANLQKHRGLQPGLSSDELTTKLFKLTPLSRIPEHERAQIISKHSDPFEAFDFVERHYDYYKKYMNANDEADQSQHSSKSASTKRR